METPIDIQRLTGHVDYHEGWDRQRRTHEQVRTGETPDTLFLLEHASVYTAGRRTNRSEYPTDGTPVIDVDRGGKITWHGPGQIVSYPIVRLAEAFDVVGYIRTLEAAVMDVCAQLGLETIRVEGRSGVWIAADGPDAVGPDGEPRLERKVCAIGARVAKGVTMHGLALNCDPDLTAFEKIVPCGIPAEDADVTSLSAELGRDVTVAEVLPLLEEALVRHLTPLLAAAKPDGVAAAPVPATARPADAGALVTGGTGPAGAGNTTPAGAVAAS
ncbi:lipoyl(octanoyl) transferase LipB [Myceligenerans pegani]|uniref:Octanoyltransferase n=1 Tax=Myceligenerans pegani TaxID=2776917 RepID=A0ABR9MTV3_9MICO|nr:lipoyl(octanoyl) transferase LipB [Myceligenerans sp. TRM 65318]MBE1874192.1 lipoyl(octanoyl) transferase LipB [Myceligenerans sp. TRM 65318]MBE3016464.1 lipoyl(octanoyl) transferase LipB [Myceligenerans sp. TRM 65318]